MSQAFGQDEPVYFENFLQLAAEKFQKYPNTIRISLGIASNFPDVYYLMAFFESLVDREADEINLKFDRNAETQHTE